MTDRVDCDVICADTPAGWCGPLNCAMAWAETGDRRFIDDPIPDYPPGVQPEGSGNE